MTAAPPTPDRVATDRLVIAAGCLAMLLVGNNSTALMVAMPMLIRELGATGAAPQWIVNAYLVASAACIIVGGGAADGIGARRASTIGLLLFVAGSVLVALSQDVALAILGRVLQGVAAAVAVPATLAAVRLAAADRARSAAISAWSAFLMLGFSIGPLVGGLMVHRLGWRAIFWLSAGGSVVATLMLLGRPAAGPSPPSDYRLDLPGFLALALALVSLIFALHNLAELGTRPAMSLLPAALAAIGFAALYRIERRATAPLLDLDLLRSRDLWLACAIGAIAMAGIMALLLYYCLYAQSPTGGALTPIATGLSLLPLSAALLACALLTPRLTARFGARRSLRGAMALLALALLALILAVRQDSQVVATAALVMAGGGLALPYASAARLALAALPPAKAGQASGIVNACTFLGGSAGVALGGIADGIGSLGAVLAMLAAAALVGLRLARRLSGVAPAG